MPGNFDPDEEDFAAGKLDPQEILRQQKATNTSAQADRAPSAGSGPAAEETRVDKLTEAQDAVAKAADFESYRAGKTQLREAGLAAPIRPRYSEREDESKVAAAEQKQVQDNTEQLGRQQEQIRARREREAAAQKAAQDRAAAAAAKKARSGAIADYKAAGGLTEHDAAGNVVPKMQANPRANVQGPTPSGDVVEPAQVAEFRPGDTGVEPFQGADGRWKKKWRDAFGNIQEVDLEANGQVHTDQTTGARTISFKGKKIDAGVDDNVVQRGKLKAERLELDRTNQEERLQLQELRWQASDAKEALKPFAKQIKTAQDTVVNLERSLTTAKGSARAHLEARLAEAKKVLQDPNYLAAKSTADTIEADIEMRQKAINDRQQKAIEITRDTDKLKAARYLPQKVDARHMSDALGDWPADAVTTDAVGVKSVDRDFLEARVAGLARANVGSTTPASETGRGRVAKAERPVTNIQSYATLLEDLQARGIGAVGGKPIAEEIAAARAGEDKLKALGLIAQKFVDQDQVSFEKFHGLNGAEQYRFMSALPEGKRATFMRGYDTYKAKKVMTDSDPSVADRVYAMQTPANQALIREAIGPAGMKQLVELAGARAQGKYDEARLAAEEKAYEGLSLPGKVWSNIVATYGGATKGMSGLVTAAPRIYGLLFQDGKMSERSAIQWADNVDRVLDDTYLEGRRGSLADGAGVLLGTGLSFLVPAGAVGTGLKALGAGAKTAQYSTMATTALIGAALNGADSIGESAQLGLSERQTWQRFAVASAAGLSEAFGIGKGAERLVNGLIKVDRATQGGFKRLLLGMARESAKEIPEEFAQEFGQQSVTGLADMVIGAKTKLDPKTGEMRAPKLSEVISDSIEGGGQGALGAILFGSLFASVAHSRDRARLRQFAQTINSDGGYSAMHDYLGELRGKLATARAEGAEEEVYELKDRIDQAQFALSQAAKKVTSVAPALRDRVANIIGPDVDAAGISAQLEENDALRFAAVEIGQAMRPFYVTGPRGAALDQVIGAASPNTGANQAAVDQMIGAHAVQQELINVLDGGKIEASKASALDQLGLLEVDLQDDGSTIYRVTDDALPLLPRATRDAIANDATGKYNVKVTAGQPGALVNNLVKSGEDRLRNAAESRNQAATAQTSAEMPGVGAQARQSASESETGGRSGSSAQGESRRFRVGLEVTIPGIGARTSEVTVEAADAGAAAALAVAQARSSAPKGATVAVTGQPVAATRESSPKPAAAQKSEQVKPAQKVDEAKAGKLFGQLYARWRGDLVKMGVAKLREDRGADMGPLALTGDTLLFNREQLSALANAAEANGLTAEQGIEDVIVHEIIHSAAVTVVSREEAAEIRATAPAALVKLAEKTYTDFDKLPDWKQGHELLRLVVEGRYRGRITEQIVRALQAILDAIGIQVGKLPENELLSNAADAVKSALDAAEVDISRSRTTEAVENPEPEKRARRERLLGNLPQGVTRGTGTADPSAFEISTPTGGIKVRGHFKVVEASELVTSDRPDYNQDLQRRDRTRGASKAQIAEIAFSLDPKRLAESATSDIGSPIVNTKGEVLSGNGRSMALRSVYEQAGKKAEEYRLFVEQKAEELGISDQLEGVRNPVLVREVSDFGTSNEAEFADISNRSQLLGRSAVETAMDDGKMLVDEGLLDSFRPGEDGDIFSASNRQFNRLFIQHTGDRAQLTRGDGSFAPELEGRVRRAVLAAIMRNLPEASEAVTSAIERADKLGLSRQVNGIMAIAGRLLKLQASNVEMDIAAPLAEALAGAIEAKGLIESGQAKNVADALGQGVLFGAPSSEANILIRMLLESNSAKAVREFLGEYARVAESAATGPSMFGDDGGGLTRLQVLQGIEEQAAMEKKKLKMAKGKSNALGAPRVETPASEESKPFFSQMTRGIEALPMERMTVSQARAMITKVGKPDEIAMSGILEDPFSPLAGKSPTDKVTKAELLGYAIERQANVVDVVLGDTLFERKEALRILNAAVKRDDLGGYDSVSEAVQGVLMALDGREFNEWSAETLEAARAYKTAGDSGARYTQAELQLPGADAGTYREMFVTWPFSQDSDRLEELREMANRSKAEEAEFTELLAKEASVNRKYWDRWSDGHDKYEDIRNPIVRIRRNLRTDENGRKVYFIEEMQGPHQGEQAKMPEALRKRIFDIGMKRALRDAADQGADAIGWTTGEQQADRYGLSKHFDAVQWTDWPAAGKDMGILSGYKGADHIFKQVISRDRLGDYVGTELARRLLSKPDGERYAEGLELKVGGEGLSALYDKTLPRIATKLAGGRVVAGKINAAQDAGGGYEIGPGGVQPRWSSPGESVHMMELPAAWKERRPEFTLFAPRVVQGQQAVDDSEIASYVREKGIADEKATEELRELATVREESHPYQLALFNPDGSATAAASAAAAAAGGGVSAAGGKNRDGNRPGRESTEQLIARSRAENAGLSNPTGPDALRALEERGRLSSVIAELVKPGAPVWDVRGAIIEGPEDAFKLLQAVRSPYVETLKVAVLNNAYQVEHSEIVSMGSLNEAVAHPREIFRALQRIAEKTTFRRMVIAHNHPSGDPSPSDADVAMTRRLAEGAKALGFEILDHVITNGRSYYSFRNGVAGNLESTAIKTRATKAKPEPEEIVKAKAVPFGQLADWETMSRESLKRIRKPVEIVPIIESLRNHAPGQAHIFYLSTKFNLLGVERFAPKSDKEIQPRMAAGAMREGAYAVILHLPGTSQNGQLQNVLSFEGIFGVRLLDVVFDRGQFGPYDRPWSAAEAGFIKEEEQLDLLSPVDAAANTAATATGDPSQAQKEAGNYRMGHTRISGLDISIENPAGSTRSGEARDGTKWSVTMGTHYGYIRGTEGRDGDHVDVMIKAGTPEDWRGTVFVVNQVDPETGKFDEHKVVLGARNPVEASYLYKTNYSKGWNGLGSVEAMSFDQFREWLSDPKRTKKRAVADELEAAKSVAELVKENMGLAVTIANSYRNIPGVDSDDVLSKAREALVKAARGWEPSERGGAPFGAYAAASIRNALTDLFRKETRRGETFVGSADEATGDNADGPSLKDNLADASAAAAVAGGIEGDETRAALEEAMAGLPERVRTVLQLSAEGKSLREIGAAIGQSYEMARRILDNGKKAVEARLRARGFSGVDADGVLYSPVVATQEIQEEADRIEKGMDTPETPAARPNEFLKELLLRTTAGRIDALDYVVPGAKNLLTDAHIRNGRITASLRIFRERIEESIKQSFGYPSWWRNRENNDRLKRFTAEILPTAARLNAVARDARGQFKFETFWMRAGELSGNQEKAMGMNGVPVTLRPGVFVKGRYEEMLRVGRKISTFVAGAKREFWQLERMVTANDQAVIYSSFHSKFPEAAHWLDSWIDPNLKDSRMNIGGIELPDFNRFSLRDFWGEISPFGEMGEVLGYTPDIFMTKSLVGMIAGRVRDLLNRTWTGPGREYKSGEARERGQVRDLFAGFNARAAEAHQETERRKLAEQLLAKALKRIPDTGVPANHVKWDVETIDQLLRSYHAVQGLDPDQYGRLKERVRRMARGPEAIDPDQAEFRSLFGELKEEYPTLQEGQLIDFLGQGEEGVARFIRDQAEFKTLLGELKEDYPTLQEGELLEFLQRDPDDVASEKMANDQPALRGAESWRLKMLPRLATWRLKAAQEWNRVGSSLFSAEDLARIDKLAGRIAAEAAEHKDKMIHVSALAELRRPLASQFINNRLLRLLDAGMRGATGGYLASPFTLATNQLSNELFVTMHTLRRALYGLFSLPFDTKQAKLGLYEAWNLIKGVVTDRWYNQRVRELVPDELFDGNHRFNTIATTDFEKSPAELLRELNVSGAMLKLMRYGNVDLRAKQRVALASYVAHGRIAWDEAKAAGKIAAGVKKGEWIRDWIQNLAPDSVHRSAYYAAMLVAMDYANVPPVLDEANQVMIGGRDVTAEVNMLRRGVAPFAKFPYNLARQGKRFTFDSVRDLLPGNVKASGVEVTRGAVTTPAQKRQAAANLVMMGMMYLLARAMMDDDKEGVPKLGRSLDDLGKRLEGAYNTAGRINVTDTPLGKTMTAALDMFGLHDLAEQGKWLRIRALPYASSAVATAFLEQRLRGKPGGAEAEENVTAVLSDMVSEGLLLKMLNALRDQKGPYDKDKNLSFIAGETAFDAATGRFLPPPLLRTANAMIDPVPRRMRPVKSLDYDPGFLAALQTKIPGAAMNLPPAGRVVNSTDASAKSEAAIAELLARELPEGSFHRYVDAKGKSKVAYVMPSKVQARPRVLELFRAAGLNVKFLDQEEYQRELAAGPD